MMRSYVLVFNDTVASRQSMLDFLDTRSEVLNWYAFSGEGIFVVSEYTAHELAAIIHQQFPALFFVVSEVVPARNDGFLPSVAWDFVNIPKSSGRWGRPPPAPPRLPPPTPVPPLPPWKPPSS